VYPGSQIIVFFIFYFLLLFFILEDDEAIGMGITFKVGGAGERGANDEGWEETNPSNPNCYAWCLINVCVSKILQQTIRKMVSGVGLEVLGEFGGPAG